MMLMGMLVYDELDVDGVVVIDQIDAIGAGGVAIVVGCFGLI